MMELIYLSKFREHFRQWYYLCMNTSYGISHPYLGSSSGVQHFSRFPSLYFIWAMPVIVSAVTNYCKFSDLKQHISIIFRSEVWHGLKIKMSAGLCNQSGGSRSEFIFLPLPASRGHPHSFSHGPLIPFSMPETVVKPSSPGITPSSCPSFTVLDPCNYINPPGKSSLLSQY